jgi:hypothetical protein
MLNTTSFIRHFTSFVLQCTLLVCPIVAFAQVGPGGVTTANMLWVKADQGVTSSGANVSLWTDQSGFGQQRDPRN